MQLGLDKIPSTIHTYQPVSKCYNSTFSSLTNAEVSEAKQANFHPTAETQFKVPEKVWLST